MGGISIIETHKPGSENSYMLPRYGSAAGGSRYFEY